MNDLTDLDGHENLGFDADGNADPDTISRHTTVTTVSSNCSTNTTPRKTSAKSRRVPKKDTDPENSCVAEEIIRRRQSSLPKNTKDTSFTTQKVIGNKPSKNKETMKYAKKEIDVSNAKTSSGVRGLDKKKQLKKQLKVDIEEEIIKDKTGREKKVKSKRPKDADENVINNVKSIMKPKEEPEENSTPKKKVKIKESLSQKIKKSHSTSTDTYNTKEPKKEKIKQRSEVNVHQRNVKYLINNAIESNNQAKEKPELPAPYPKDDCDRLSQTKGNDLTNQHSGLDKGKDLLLKNIDTDNGSILNKKENKGRIQPLERVETDDCTSIDTSTFPVPPDEMLATSQNSDLPFQERFIA